MRRFAALAALIILTTVAISIAQSGVGGGGQSNVGGGGGGGTVPSIGNAPNLNYWYLVPQSLGCGTLTNCTAIYGDTRFITDGTSNSTTTFTCPNADCNFTAADVGKVFWATTAGTTSTYTTAGNFTTFVCPQTTIQTVNSATSVTLANACTASGTANVYTYWGHSDGTTLHALDGGSDCRTFHVFSGAQIMIDQAEFITPPTGCTGGSGHAGQRDWWTGATSLTVYLTPNFNYATCTGNGGTFLGTTVCIGSGLFQFYNTQISGTGLTPASNSNCANASGKTILALNPIAGALYEVDVNGICPGETGNGVVLNSFDENWVEGGAQSVMQNSCVAASTAVNTSNLDCINDLAAGAFGHLVTNNAIQNDYSTYPYVSVKVLAGSTLQSHGTSYFSINGVYGIDVFGTFISDGDHLNCTVAGSGCMNIDAAGVVSARSTTFTQGAAVAAFVNGVGGSFIDQGGNTITTSGGGVGFALLQNSTTVSATSGMQTISGTCQGTATSSSTLGLYLAGENTTPNCTSTTVNLGTPMTRAGNAHSLGVFDSHVGVSASSGVVTVLKNGGATTVTCTLGTARFCADDTHSFTYAVGDIISIQFTTQGSEVLAGVSATVFAW